MFRYFFLRIFATAFFAAICVCVYVIFWLYPANGCLCVAAPCTVSRFSAFDMERNGFYTLIDGRLLRVSQPTLSDLERSGNIGRESKSAQLWQPLETLSGYAVRERESVCPWTVVVLLLLQCPIMLP